MDIVFIMKSDYIDKVVECCIEREKVLSDISNMNVANGLPGHFVMISVSASNCLKYGIPKNFP